MKLLHGVRTSAVVLASFGLLAPQIAHAAKPLNQPAQPGRPALVSIVSDIALQSGGELHGQVVDVQGAPQAGVQVWIGARDKTAAIVQTDALGRFRTAGLSGGVYRIETAAGGGVYRCWAPQTAPPSARQEVLVVNSSDIVRGQGRGGFLRLLSNPWFLGGVAATAMVGPLVLDRKKAS